MEEQGLLLSDISRSKPVQHYALTTVRRSCSAENMPCEKVNDDRLGKTSKRRRKSLERKEEFTRENARKTRSTSMECSVDIDQLINDGSPRVVGRVTGSGLGNELSITNKNNLDSVSWSKMQKGSTMPIYLKFSEIRYKVRGKGKTASEMENILFGVTGSVDPGEILALMGPSGGGKTTLLNLLSGRTNIKDQGGSVTYNDQPYSKWLKGRIGFVLQDDVAFPHLTVRETLTYTALLRLPNIRTKQQKEERAMSVISELGLERCQDMLIGGALVRGISGGERKRVCIGNEILLDPSLLFLDEPTSGLDSTTALRIAQMLQNIAQYLVGAYEIKVASTEKMKFSEPVPMDSKWETKGSVLREVGASWWEQYSILFWRGSKERRHDYLSYVRVTQVLSTAVIIGLLWWHSDSSSPEKLQDQAGLLYFISVFWGFFPVFTAFFTFPQERAILSKERSVGMYKLSAYFIARTMSDLVLDLIMPVAFLVIVYFMVGLKPVFTVFLKSLMSVLLCVVAAQGLGLAIGAALIDIKKATTLASIIIMTFMLAGGFFVERVPFFMSWIRYVSFNYHTYRLLLKVQYDCSNARHNGFKPCLSTFVEGLGLDNGGIEAGALIAMVFGYRLMAYLFLRNIKIRCAN